MLLEHVQLSEPAFGLGAGVKSSELPPSRALARWGAVLLKATVTWPPPTVTELTYLPVMLVGEGRPASSLSAGTVPWFEKTSET